MSSGEPHRVDQERMDGAAQLTSEFNMVAEPGVHGINATAGVSTPGSRGPLGSRTRAPSSSPLGHESKDIPLDLSLTPEDRNDTNVSPTKIPRLPSRTSARSSSHTDGQDEREPSPHRETRRRTSSHPAGKSRAVVSSTPPEVDLGTQDGIRRAIE